MAEALDQESLRGLDVFSLGDLTVFAETVLNASAGKSLQEHGAPDCSAHIPALAEAVAKKIHDDGLSSVQTEDRQKWYSDNAFRAVNTIIYRFLVDKEIVVMMSLAG